MLQVLGRLHPALVHFPIALLLAALVAELLRPRRDGPGEAGFFCLVLGTLGALAAAGSGWLFADHDPPGMPALLLRHRWAGVGAAVSASVTLLSAWRWRRGDAQLARPTRIGIALTAVLVGAAGHVGGEMVYGEGFALEPLREGGREAPAVGDVSAQAQSGEHPPAQAPAGVDYLAEVQPILARRCYECHGDRKRPKGKLKLSDMASVLARPPDDAVIVPGDPAASELYRRVRLAPEDEDVMPPEGGPLSTEEIDVLRNWIEEGAPWSPVPGASDATPAEAETDAPAPLVRLDDAQRAARDAALAALRARGAHARRLAQDDDAVEVDLGVVPGAGDADLALLAGLEPCLVELSLARTTVTDAGLARLADFEALRRLRLGHTGVGDAGVAALRGLTHLESLDLFETRVGEGALTALESLPALARLYVGGTALGETALEELQRRRPGLAVER